MIPLVVNNDNIEVNIDYPDVLYDLHNNYPLATEKIKPKNETLSQVKIIEDKKFLLGKIEKFISNTGNKSKYKLYYQGLKIYLKLRLQLRKIHWVLEFKQKAFLRPYIECNIELQREAVKEANTAKYKNAELKNNAIWKK